MNIKFIIIAILILIVIYLYNNKKSNKDRFGLSSLTKTSITTTTAPITKTQTITKSMLDSLNISNLFGLYTVDSYKTGTVLSDLSGKNYNATVSGTITKINNYLTGSTSTNISFPQVLPTNYTLFHICKYNGDKKKRIIQGSENWLSGFYNGHMGVAYHRNWITENNLDNIPLFIKDDWLLSSDQPNLYRANKSDYTAANNGSNVNVKLTINTGDKKDESSDWAVVCIILYDKLLTNDEINKVEDLLIKTYSDLFPEETISYDKFSFKPSDLPVTSQLSGFYNSTSYSYSTPTLWKDLVSGKSATITNAFSKYPVTKYSNYITGSKDTKVEFSFVLPTAYTLFHVCTYNGSNRQRIIQSTQSWLSGFHGNNKGIAYHGTTWITKYEVDNITTYSKNDWLLSTDQPNLYRANKSDYTDREGGTNTDVALTINTGKYYKEVSDWGIACIIVYDRILTNDEINAVEDKITSMYSNLLPIEIISSNTFSFKKSELPITTGLYGFYNSTSYSYTTPNIWTDLSGSNNNATIINNVSNKYPVTKYYNYITGSHNTSIQFPTSKILPSTYTLFHICKYNGPMKKRILQGTTKNWLSGFNNGYKGVAFHEGWLTENNQDNIGDLGSTKDIESTLKYTANILKFSLSPWILSTDQNKLYRSNQVDYTTNTNYDSYDTLAVNYGKYNSEISDWAIACIIVYNRTLSIDEIKLVENTLYNKYNNLIKVTFKNITTPLTLDTLGYSCNINDVTKVGTTTIPIKVNNNIISIPSSDGKTPVYLKDSTECNSILNDFIYTDTPIVCSEGKIGSICTKLYDSIGIKTLGELGYECNNNIANGNVPGKIKNNDSEYEVISYNNKTIDTNCKKSINFQPISELKNVVCSEYNKTIDTKYPNICKQSFDEYNLYHSANPLTIKGKNINYNIPNKITNSVILSNLSNTNSSIYEKYYEKNYDANTSSTFPATIGKVLEQSPLKLGCCMRNNNDNKAINVTIRAPLSPDVAADPANKDLVKYNFQKSVVSIPAETCPTYMYAGSDYCNTFFQTNCENVLTVFNENKNLTSSDFINYAPECACYAPATGALANVPLNIPPMCYKAGCQVGSSSYIDPVSRAQGSCNSTICANIVQVSGVSAGNNADINPVLENNCGNQIPSTSVSSSSSSTPSSSKYEPASYSATQTTTTPVTSQVNAPVTSQTTAPITSTNSIQSFTPKTNNSSVEISSDYTLYIIAGVVILLLCSSSSLSLAMKKKK